MVMLRSRGSFRFILIAIAITGILTFIWMSNAANLNILPIPYQNEAGTAGSVETPEANHPPHHSTTPQASESKLPNQAEAASSSVPLNHPPGPIDTPPAVPVKYGWQDISQGCPHYTSYSSKAHLPKSQGKLGLGFQRPEAQCRTFVSKEVEKEIDRIRQVMTDPDLFRLFENTFPSTIDTCVKWMGVSADNPDEELAFIITGDIDAMWLRDSANQLQVYRDLITSRTDELAALFRGAINMQARYIMKAPYCNAFQAPPESNIPVGYGGGGSTVYPFFDRKLVFTCNFELDSLGAFLQLSQDYFQATGDIEFFGKFHWIDAIKSIMETAADMSESTYDEDGKPRPLPYKFNSQTTTMTGTLNNIGTGNPVAYTGMVRSPFRPSDDTAVFEFLVPSNMMFARYLETAAKITKQLSSAPQDLATQMEAMAHNIREAISKHAVIEGPGNAGPMYAFEVDGFGGRNLMDDANIPSLLSAPFLGYLDAEDTVYQNTRKFVLSKQNPWYCEGHVINGVGGPHIKPGAAWPMSSTVQIMTSNNNTEIEKALLELLSSTNGIGLMHESIKSDSAQAYTRPWFSWANGLFGQTVLDLSKRKPELISKSYQSIIPEWAVSSSPEK
ncbi:Meiotically up-regulated protein 157 [Ceratocystis fimbriata CBS 114723]|uniref:Meiotically up-regulated protein 157 n=1 Tax=Ceratocystis fimbriata CBS 114723 TaxID=1035309 RepID=A0A2C5WVV4_9PEZI|nr:Meiotically up-regulated protein 157 [Ceratocystis fimbriata CBS 114723]